MKMAKKISGDLASKLASAHVNISLEELIKMTDREIVKIIRSLAASVLSQSENIPAKEKKRMIETSGLSR